MDGTLILIGGGALAFALSQDDGLPDPGPPTPQKVGSRPVPINQILGDRVGSMASQVLDNFGGILGGRNQGTAGGTNPNLSSGGGNYYTGANSTQQRVLNEMEARAKAEYDRLSKEAKKKGAEALNKELGTDLTGDESFKEASNKIGAAIGGVAAGAACAAIPGVGAAAAPACAILGSIAGAYLGEKIGKWAKDAYNAVTDWTEDAWDDVSDWISSLP